MTTLGADLLANELLPSVLNGKSFPLPTVDLNSAAFQLPAATGPLFANITKLTNADLTSGVVGGSGVFDALMAGIDAHLKREYEANRITGAEYSKVYIALVEAALSNATQFLLAREQAYWQAEGAKYQAQTQMFGVVSAKVGVETAKVQLQLASYQAMGAEADYALTKIKLATEDVSYGTAKYALTNIAPEQLKLVKEQAEAQRAQTLDTRSDGGAVTGSIGKQKDLYTQQITSYQRDAEVKAAKMFIDSWITQKTIDEALTAPSTLQNASVDAILSDIKTLNGLRALNNVQNYSQFFWD